jgi:hypothetical protein
MQLPLIPATQEEEIQKIKVQGQPGQKVSKTPHLNNNIKKARHGGTCLLSQLGGSQSRPAQAKGSTWKVTRFQGYAQVVERLPGKLKALNSNPSKLPTPPPPQKNW